MSDVSHQNLSKPNIVSNSTGHTDKPPDEIVSSPLLTATPAQNLNDIQAVVRLSSSSSAEIPPLSRQSQNNYVQTPFKSGQQQQDKRYLELMNGYSELEKPDKSQLNTADPSAYLEPRNVQVNNDVFAPSRHTYPPQKVSSPTKEVNYINSNAKLLSPKENFGNDHLQPPREADNSLDDKNLVDTRL